ncbi:MAG: TetR/AcrR family transcriptional regulator [Deltaproteobacteria bacterium]|nr:TetR/AcrR family transcriptional regulator [Deltaproteobacteria bacterium]
MSTAANSDVKSTRQRILDSAEHLFADKGLAGTAVRDIAAGVGLNAASLYNHFAGKEELYEAVLERGLRPILELVSELVSEESPADADERALDRVVLHLAQHPNLAKLVQYEALAGGERLVRIGGRWLEPIYSRGLEALSKSKAEERWTPEELPLLLVAFQNLVLGYFAMAPLMQQAFGLDPTSDEALQRQMSFLRKATRLLLPPREGL